MLGSLNKKPWYTWERLEMIIHFVVICIADGNGNKFTFLGIFISEFVGQWNGKEVHLNKCLKWYGNIYILFRAPLISEFIKHLEGKKQGTLE